MMCHTLSSIPGDIRRKKGYSSRKRALSAMHKLCRGRGLNPQDFSVYKCGQCNDWHFGRRNDREDGSCVTKPNGRPMTVSDRLREMGDHYFPVEYNAYNALKEIDQSGRGWLRLEEVEGAVAAEVIRRGHGMFWAVNKKDGRIWLYSPGSACDALRVKLGVENA